MYAAASRGHAEVVRLLIKADAVVNQATVCTLDGGAARRVRLSVLWKARSGVDGVAVYVCCVLATGCVWSVLGH